MDSPEVVILFLGTPGQGEESLVNTRVLGALFLVQPSCTLPPMGYGTGWRLGLCLKFFPNTSEAPGKNQPAHNYFATAEERDCGSCLMPVSQQQPGAFSPSHKLPSPLKLGHMSILCTQRVKEEDIQPLGAAELSGTFSLLGIAAEC